MSTFDSQGYAAGNRVVTAYFEDRAAAQQAMERLVAMGVPETQIRLTEGNTGGTGYSQEQHKGFWDSLADLFIPNDDRYTYAEGLNRGGFLLSARVSDASYDRALDILDDNGTVDISEREQSWRSEGWTGYDSTRSEYAEAPIAGMTGTGVGPGYDTTTRSSAGYGSTTGSSAGYAADTDRLGSEEVIPVVREDIAVGKRDVSHGRVRVRSYTVSEPVREDVELRDERVSIERRPVDRAVSPGDAVFQDRTIELEERGEEAVVSKQARVTEEVLLHKDTTRRTEEVADTVRRTEVEIEDDRGVLRDDIPRRG